MVALPDRTPLDFLFIPAHHTGTIIFAFIGLALYLKYYVYSNKFTLILLLLVMLPVFVSDKLILPIFIIPGILLTIFLLRYQPRQNLMLLFAFFILAMTGYALYTLIIKSDIIHIRAFYPMLDIFGGILGRGSGEEVANSVLMKPIYDYVIEHNYSLIPLYGIVIIFVYIVYRKYSEMHLVADISKMRFLDEKHPVGAFRNQFFYRTKMEYKVIPYLYVLIVFPVLFVSVMALTRVLGIDLMTERYLVMLFVSPFLFFPLLAPVKESHIYKLQMFLSVSVFLLLLGYAVYLYPTISFLRILDYKPKSAQCARKYAQLHHRDRILASYWNARPIMIFNRYEITGLSMKPDGEIDDRNTFRSRFSALEQPTGFLVIREDVKVKNSTGLKRRKLNEKKCGDHSYEIWK